MYDDNDNDDVRHTTTTYVVDDVRRRHSSTTTTYAMTTTYDNDDDVQHTVTVTVTEALVLRPLLEDRGRITESIRILVPVNRKKQECFQIATEQVCRPQQFQFRR